ncbi:hypothetical protein [Geobacillus sp. FJAT-46040]|uniref:hypothetical protein n=1 Tax=Geobacillus sp. FJAT-46040 TaxID=2011017 RepID=UPI001E4A964E|nr:hypothetical protein [Geobacillus sp. FJAT-46040]
MEMATKPVIIGGRTAKKPLIAALLGGFLLLGALLSIFGLTGVAYAVPISGVGEFTVQFDKLNGSGYKFNWKKFGNLFVTGGINRYIW